MVVAKAPRKSYAATQWLQCVLLLLGDIADGLTPKLAMTLSSQCNIKLFPGTFLSLLFGNTIINYLEMFTSFFVFFPLKVSKKMKNRRLHHLHRHHESHLKRKSFRLLSSLWKGLTLFRCCHVFPKNMLYKFDFKFLCFVTS